MSKFFKLFNMAPTEFGAGNGCGNGHIEAVGSGSLVEIGDEQPMADSLANSVGNAVALVAHDDETSGRKLLGVDVLSVEESAIDGEVLRQRIEQGREVSIIYVYARDTAHRGLNYLRVPGVGCVGTANDRADAKPVGYADDSAEVAWILNAVQSQRQVVER